MALSSKHSKSVQSMSSTKLVEVVKSGSLLAAAAKAELQKRGAK